MTMGHYKLKNPNFMGEMQHIIREIDKLKPEPEMCNVSCPPFGCPLGPCPGMCSNSSCDPCCVSTKPKNSVDQTCPSRSYPSQAYAPSSCQIASFSSPYFDQNVNLNDNLHFKQNSSSPNLSTFNQTRQIKSPSSISPVINQNNLDQCRVISVCQVPQTNHHKKSENQVNFRSPNLNFNSPQQSCSSTIEICYPPVFPSFSTRSVMPKRNNLQMSPCPPQTCNRLQQIHHNNSGLSTRHCQIPRQSSCPSNSPYLVTIPHR